MRRLIFGACVLIVMSAGLLIAADAAEEREAPFVAADLAYSQVLAFDYDQDGESERVQFWLRLEGVPALGKPGEREYRAETGQLYYVVYDVDAKTKVENWSIGFNMGFPMAEKPYPITNIDVRGRTASFEFQGATWTIKDGGESWEDDSITIQDHRGTRPLRFYAGNARVVPDPWTASDPMDIEANRECNECHTEAAVSMAVVGGPHRKLACELCHVEHPPDVEGALAASCGNCHEPHSRSMRESSCTKCHASHDVNAVVYGVDIPDGYCVACHQDASDTLQASGTLHTGLSCVLCHAAEHGASVECVYCHRATHPTHVMESSGVCGKCHNTAHETASGRS